MHCRVPSHWPDSALPTASTTYRNQTFNIQIGVVCNGVDQAKLLSSKGGVCSILTAKLEENELVTRSKCALGILPSFGDTLK